ncbi:MAG: hypothetical protein ACOC1X_00040 [Promethearchaeota archaeon]
MDLKKINGWILYRHVSGWGNSEDFNDYEFFPNTKTHAKRARKAYKKHMTPGPTDNPDLIGGALYRVKNGKILEKREKDGDWKTAYEWGWNEEIGDMDMVEVKLGDLIKNGDIQIETLKEGLKSEERSKRMLEANSQ